MTLKRARRFVQTVPPVEWDRRVFKMSIEERQELASLCDIEAQHMTRLSGYLDLRGVVGGGDSGHVKAVKRSNLKVKRVRKALGYTYPGHDLNF